MFYEPAKRDRSVLPHDPFKALVAPRPIGWVSTVDGQGRVNLAPYSFFNAVSDNPHIVAFASDGKKDSVVNAEETGDFVMNLVSWELREAMNETSASYPRGIDEMAAAGLAAAPSRIVKSPRVRDAAWALECRWLQTLPMTTLEGVTRYFLVTGQVVGVHIDDRFVKNGRVDTAAMRPVARAGYDEYAVMTEAFRMTRPD
jgi:flavin reductase (DIM6/NTAB) family NADH-FMN oxidoreductase RutF